MKLVSLLAISKYNKFKLILNYKINIVIIKLILNYNVIHWYIKNFSNFLLFCIIYRYQSFLKYPESYI